MFSVWHLSLLKNSSQSITSPKNSFTVELLIGFAWTAEQTLYLYFLVLIKLHWELYVFITFLPTP